MDSNTEAAIGDTVAAIGEFKNQVLGRVLGVERLAAKALQRAESAEKRIQTAGLYGPGQDVPAAAGRELRAGALAVLAFENPRPEVPTGAAADAEREEFRKFIISRTERTWLEGPDAQAALSESSDPAGGYMVQTVIAPTIERVLHDQSPIRRFARIERLLTGDALEEIYDRDDTEAVWIGETSVNEDTDTPEVGKHRFPLHEMEACPRATQRVLDDSGVDLEAWLTGKITDKFGRLEGTAFVSGDGVLRPRGFTTYPTAATPDSTRDWGTIEHVVTGQAATLPATVAATLDLLEDVVAAMKPDYLPGAAWFGSRRTFAKFRKLRDQNDIPLLTRDIAEPGVMRMLGYPIVLCEDMPAIGADAYPLAFANLRRSYLILDRPGLRILRDPFTAKPWVKFYTTRRTGGGVFNYEAIKLVKVSA